MLFKLCCEPFPLEFIDGGGGALRFLVDFRLETADTTDAATMRIKTANKRIDFLGQQN